MVNILLEKRLLTIDIPGYKTLSISHLVLDFNGTLAVDGKLIKGVRKALNTLSQTLKIHVLTGDIHGTAREELKNVECYIKIIPPENQIMEKSHFIQRLLPEGVAAIGNGRNDSGMIKQAHLGILVVGEEGGAAEVLKIADIVVIDVMNALGLFLKSQRLVATLRS